MKTRLVFLLPFLLLFFLFSCKSTDTTLLDVSKSEFTNISADGETLTISISSNSSWSVSSSSQWCKPDKETGSDDDVITLTVSANNEQGKRTATVTITSGSLKRKITVSQTALILSATEAAAYHYKIPVIFHVLYQDKSNNIQYIKEGRVNEIIAACNKLYNNSNGKSVDMNMEFVLATEDPNGNRLTEPGVERISWNSPTINCDEFMESINNKAYLNLVWDTNKYINVMLYTFTNENILGISVVPYTTTPDILDGLIQLSVLPMHSSLPYPHCVSINNTYIYSESSVEGQLYVPADIVSTIAHELGHYLGLLHAFNEERDAKGNVIGTDICEDTDYCDDTPAYNRTEYETYLSNYTPLNGSKITFNDLPNLMKRKDCILKTTSTPNNIMDYMYSYVNRFTNEQRARIRYVLSHSPLIPGPKVARSTTTRVATEPQEFPVRILQ